MTIALSENTPRIQYTVASGITQTAFTVNFEFYDEGDLNFYVDNVLKTIATHYTVTGGDGTTGTINTTVGNGVTGISGGSSIIISRDIALSRITDFPSSGSFQVAKLNTELDRLTAISSDLNDGINRTIRMPDSDPALNIELPSAADRADKIFKFDTEGNIEAVTANSLIANTIIGANFANNVFTGDGSTVVYTLSTEPGSKNNCQVYVDGVYQEKSTFSISTATLTFTEAPPLNASIEVIVGKAIDSFASDANAVNYDQGGTGYVSRTVENKLRDVVSVKDFGAVGDNLTDNRTEFQSAIDVAVADNKAIYIPEGIYRVSGELTVSNSTKFFGDGWGSVVMGTFATGNMFTISSENPVSFFDIKISSTVSKTVNAAIYYDAGATKQNNYSVIDNCIFENQFNGIYCYRNAYQKISNNHFVLNTASGTSIHLENATSVDAGDQVVSFNQIYGGSGVIGVHHRSGGGLRLIGNKFLQIQNGYYAQFTGTAQSGISVISGNSFDGCTNQSIVMTTEDTAILTDISVANNIFGGLPTQAFMYLEQAGSSSLGRVAITGNTVIQNSGSVDIITLTNVGQVSVTGNSFSGSGNITIGSGCSVCAVTENILNGVAVSNASSSSYFANPNATKTLISNGGVLLGAETSTTVVGKINSITPTNTENVFYMFKSGQVEATQGFKSSTDTNFYVGSGSSTIGTYGVYLTNTGNSWNSVSDETQKTILENIENATQKISTLRTVIGHYNNDAEQTRRPFLIAQDVQAVLPEAVNVQDAETGVLGMSYTDVIPLLTAAIKEQQETITALETRITALEA
jgi:hypothetical protein